jgi:hypothetical protein
MFADIISWAANIIQVGSLVWLVALTMWERREVQILARCATTGATKTVAKIPARFVSRAEVLGLTAQAAGGQKLDNSLFSFDYHFTSEVVVDLPEESFKLLR